MHDEADNCATAHVLVFDTRERAANVAAALGGYPLGGSVKHNYELMRQLHGEFGRLDAAGDSAVGYSEAGDLPRTDDILARSVALSIGVVDSYLGTLGGITVRDTGPEVAVKAAAIRNLIEAVA